MNDEKAVPLDNSSHEYEMAGMDSAAARIASDLGAPELKGLVAFLLAYEGWVRDLSWMLAYVIVGGAIMVSGSRSIVAGRRILFRAN